MASNCCTSDGSCHTGETAQAETTQAQSPTPAADGTTVTYRVDGVGSAHCQAVVTKAVGGLDGVTAVEAGIGTGLVTVTTGGDPDDALIAETVDEAGYDFLGRA